MKQTFFPSLLGAVIVLWSVTSCKNDDKTIDNKTAFANLIEETLQQAQSLRLQHVSFQEKFAQLDNAMATVPTEVKEKVVGYGELESLLEGLGEKGDYRVQELNGIVTQLQTLRDDLSTGKVELVSVNNILVNLKPTLAEHQGAVAELTKQYEALSAACAQVTASVPTGGKGLILFATDSAAPEAPK